MSEIPQSMTFLPASRFPLPLASCCCLLLQVTVSGVVYTSRLKETTEACGKLAKNNEVLHQSIRYA